MADESAEAHHSGMLQIVMLIGLPYNDTLIKYIVSILDYRQVNSLDLNAVQVFHAVGIDIRFMTAVVRDPLRLVLERKYYGQNKTMQTE